MASGNNLIQPQFRTIDGTAIRYAQSEQKPHQALLLNPWPESLFAFEPTWARLAERAHLVAVDAPGFGQSERRDELMAPKALGEFIVKVADSFGLENPHAVCPDIGTSALLFAAAAHPDRFRSLVIGSGASAYPLRLGGALKEWVEAPSLDQYRQAGGRPIVAAALSTIKNRRLPEWVRADYLSSYEGDRFAESMRYVRAYPTELPILGDLLPSIETPVQIINGSQDDAVLPVNAEFLHARLPNSKLDFIDAGHFVWEEDADQYAALVTSWWDGGYASV